MARKGPGKKANFLSVEVELLNNGSIFGAHILVKVMIDQFLHVDECFSNVFQWHVTHFFLDIQINV
jgi:hypothetical protein